MLGFFTALATVCLGLAFDLPMIPGLLTNAGRDGSVFNRGFDPVMLESREPIITYHYTNNKSNYNQWLFPDDGYESSAVYAVPDEMYVFATPGAEFDSTFEKFTNLSTVETWQYHDHWSAVIAIVYNSVRANFEGFVKYVVEEQGSLVALSEFQTVAYKVNLYSSSVLQSLMQVGGSQYDSPFATELRNLPANRQSDDDKAAYEHFIERFGTHYVSGAVYGSTLEFVVALNAQLAVAMGAEFDANLKISLELILIAMGMQFKAGGEGKASLNITFQERAYIVLSAMGGDSAALAAGNYSQWLDTVHLNPVPTNVSYTSIAELIGDPTIAQNFLDASSDYISYWNTSGTFPAYSCASPPGTNLTIAQIPDTLRAPQLTKEQALQRRRSKDPVPLPALALSSVGRTYDVKTGDLVLSTLPPPTFNDNNMWKDPFSGQVYQLPDNHLLTSAAAVCISAEEQVIANLSAVADMYATFSFAFYHFKLFHIPISINFKHITAGFAAELNEFASAMLMLEFRLSVFDLSRPAGLEMDAAFQADVAALPASASPAYDAFIGRWGSHYVGSESYGAYCNFTVTFDQSLFAGYSWDWKKQQSRLKALPGLDLLGVGTWMNEGLVSARNGTADVKFSAHANFSFHCTGGDPSLLGTADKITPKSWDRWIMSVRANPQPITRSVRLRALSELVASPAKRQLLDQAIVAYLSKDASPFENSREEFVPKPALTEVPAPVLRKFDSNAALGFFPGVCNGAGNVGVGCGYDATQLDINGLQAAPKRPVVQMKSCALKCYLNPSSGDPDCEYCTYANPFDPNKFYRVPDNVFVADSPARGGCFESTLSVNMDQYDQQIWQHWSHSSGFIIRHHTSKTQEDFYHMYYEQDNSQTLASEFLIYSTVTLADLVDTPTWEFKLALDLLPLKYDKVKYRQFILDFGTHYMTQASVGGMALATTFYHSCFLEQYSGEYVWQQSSNSFIFVFNDGSASGHGTNTTDKLFEEWSQQTVKLVGGEAGKYLKLGRNNTLNQTECALWEKSVLGPKMQPIQFQLASILDLVPPNSPKFANLNQSLADYDAEIAQQQIDLQKVLEPRDPWIKPSWCNYSPKPPPPKGDNSKRLRVGDLPSCPPLPAAPAVWKGKKVTRKH